MKQFPPHKDAKLYYRLLANNNFFFCKSRYLTIGNRNDGRCVPASLCFLTHYFFLAINEKVVFHCFLFIQNRKSVSIFSRHILSIL